MFSRLDNTTRIALMQASEEARHLGHPTMGPEHLLLGLLSDRRSPTADLLLAHGLSFEGCREAVVTFHRDHPELAEAPASDESEESPETDPAQAYEEDREALKALGIDLDRVREAVRSTFGDDLAEDWGGRPDRRGRGRGRGRGPYGGPHRHPRGHGRGRRGPRGGGPFGLPFRDSLKDVLRDTMRALAMERVEERLEDRFERPERGDRRRGPGRLDAGRVLLALLDNPDPALQAALTGLDADAVRRALGAVQA